MGLVLGLWGALEDGCACIFDIQLGSPNRICIVHGVVTSTPGILVGISQHPHLLSCNDLCKACLLEGSL